MRAPSNNQLAGIFFLIATVLLVLIATHKTKVVTETSNINQTDTTDTVTKYIDEVERKNELERDQKEQANKLAKMIKAKKDSTECQFWMQQKPKKSINPRVSDKITQFCGLPLDQTAALTPSTGTL